MSSTGSPAAPADVAERSDQLFAHHLATIHRRADRLFALLLALEWAAGLLAALWLSPLTWTGASSETHPHVWAALWLGGAITVPPILLIFFRPGAALTRHVVVVAQMLWSALLIHLTGGRIETHFHVFGSLALIAWYRDWKILVTATAVVIVDHFLRGLYYPQSVYGVLTASPWRTLEHGGWVLFENLFLFLSIRESHKQMRDIAASHAELELHHRQAEAEVRSQARRLRGAEEELRQAQKMEAVGRLAGGVAHDFNNLLTVIMGHSELLLTTCQRSDGSRESLTEIQAAANRAAALTGQLLAFSRKQILAPKLIDLNHIITDLEKMLRRLIGEDIELTAVLDPRLARVYADPGQIQQVIMNLAVNARDAMPRGGRLTIETRMVDLEEPADAGGDDEVVRPGRYATMTMTDTGCGMDAETKARLFEPFFTTKEQGKGTGLGLATVYGIVRQSNGLITVYSERGVGTTFRIYLPGVPEGPEPPSPALARADTAPGSGTVLLVEDEAKLRDLARMVLQKSGYTVLEARDGQEGLSVAQEHGGAIDLVVTDVVMPHMGGRQMVECLARLRPSVKVLYMSGYTDDSIIRHGILEAGTNFLQKPFSPYELASKVREALDRRGPRPHAAPTLN